MAVKDGISYYPTEHLISKLYNIHYLIPVRSQHWQLRSLIGVEKQDTVYFPGGNGSNRIQRFNTTNEVCETVKLLSFSPRCLVAEKGWVCCGGETGEFTAVQINEEENDTSDSTDLDLRLDFEADSRLPLDFENTRTEGASSSLLAQARRLDSRLNKHLTAKSMRLAQDRVNCITLWFPPTTASPAEGVYDEPVAVLANNDRTAVLVSLKDFEANDRTKPLDTITYPDYVNRAILSPDGRLLIAILDDPFLYVHRRVESTVDDQSSLESRGATAYEWELCRKIILRSQRKGDLSDNRGSFAACFSRTGAYLAIGTQYGYISIFDANLFTDLDAEPLLTSFPSSRPYIGAGAVRDMAFCPGPYDLLAWTEDKGRVGVVDIRSGFVYQQFLDISVRNDFQHIRLLDQNTIDPRLLQGQGERAINTMPFQPPRVVASEARRRREALRPAERQNVPLTQEETAVLEALQADRRRREQSDRIAARLTDYTGPNAAAQLPWAGRLPRPGGSTGDDAANNRFSRVRSSSVSRAARQSELQSRERTEQRVTRELNEWLRDSNSRLRAAQRLGQDPQAGERRSITAPRRTTAVGPSGASSSTPRATGGVRTTIGANLASLSDLEALYNMSLETSSSNVRDNEDSDRDRDRERDPAIFLPFINSVAVREMDNRHGRVRVPADYGMHETPPEPHNTAGIAWSEDGRYLFVGAENGIYKFEVDTQGRKMCPELTFR